jgi:hypothetical protein
MGSALMDAGVPPNPVRVAGHAEVIVDLGRGSGALKLWTTVMNSPSAERSGLATRLPDGPANRSLSWVRAATWENRWRELTPSVVVSACREREGGLLKSGSALANGRGYGRRVGFAPLHDHMPKF